MDLAGAGHGGPAAEAGDVNAVAPGRLQSLHSRLAAAGGSAAGQHSKARAVRCQLLAASSLETPLAMQLPVPVG
ncbi:hypothetical protein HaLaN_17718 [Haematococcus lacustris]|uniref:Uncharacterized protein n=1 Tax=Haematococcus lacustris TaxID=44745 RepID=A0A699ZPA7_HAELA|nr:hypothetical protein HaLaN_17718 [Haematococcus lacustris]